MERISTKAIDELREVLVKEIGAEATESFSDEELNTIGVALLNVLVEGLKMKVASLELRTSRV